MLENSLYKKGGPSLPPLDGKCNSRNSKNNVTTTDVCFSVDCLFREQTRSELFVVKGDCNNNFSVVVCRKILSPPRRFKVKDLICDTSQIVLRNNASIFFKRVTPYSSINQVQVQTKQIQVVEVSKHTQTTKYAPRDSTFSCVMLR